MISHANVDGLRPGVVEIRRARPDNSPLDVYLRLEGDAVLGRINGSPYNHFYDPEIMDFYLSDNVLRPDGLNLFVVTVPAGQRSVTFELRPVFNRGRHGKFQVTALSTAEVIREIRDWQEKRAAAPKVTAEVIQQPGPTSPPFAAPLPRGEAFDKLMDLRLHGAPFVARVSRATASDKPLNVRLHFYGELGPKDHYHLSGNGRQDCVTIPAGQRTVEALVYPNTPEGEQPPPLEIEAEAVVPSAPATRP